MKNNTRRSFIKTAGTGLLATPFVGNPLSSGTAEALVKPKVEQIMPPLAKVILNVRDMGAIGDGVANDTLSIQQTIDRCHVLGGGEVVFPPGRFFTGAIAIKSNVTLVIDEQATIIGSPDFAAYPLTQVRWEGKWVKGHIGLIYAVDAINIGIKGKGNIVGNHALGGRPTASYPYRHPALIEPVNCSRVHMEGFSTDNYLMWSLHPTYCDNVVIKDLTIRSTGGNGDGIDIDSCKHVLIDSCDIATGDDCISLKSGRGMEGYSLLRTTEDVHITNCTFSDSIFACIGIGSETSGGIRNVRVDHCKFIAAKTFAIYIKSQPGRGGFIENITVDNIDVSGAQGGFLRFNILSSGLQDQVPVPGIEGIPTIKNFNFSNIRVTGVTVLVSGTGIHPDKPLDGFSLVNVSGTCEKGISLANIKKAKLQNIKVTGYSGPLLSINNVTGTGLENAVTIEAPKTGAPIPVAAIPYTLK